MSETENQENEYPEASARSYLLNTDGSGTGTVANPSKAGVGVVLRDPDGNLLDQLSKPIGRATNTVAEYRGLIEGLELAKLHRISRIRVFLDSELVVDQINGVAQVKAKYLEPLHKEALDLFKDFPNRRISWVPRKWNKEADVLATAGANANRQPAAEGL